MINQPAAIAEGLRLPVMEHFYTIQGEGGNAGKPAYFIRLGGCDVGCTWCDVKESWSFDAHPIYDIEEIVGWVIATNAKNVVITGGEPSLYQLGLLTKSLKQKGLNTWIETSGTNDLTGIWDWICFSPKKFKPPVNSIFEQAHEFKVIVANKHDLQWGLDLAQNLNKNCVLYFQPEWEKAKKMLPLIIDFVKDYPNWQISLQTHKYMDIP